MHLTFIDLVLILVIFGFAFYGFFIGLVQAVGGVVGMLLGIYLSGKFYRPIGGWIAPLVGGNESLAFVISFVAIMAIASRLVGFLFYIINKVFKIIAIIPFLKSINRIAGAVFGLVEGILLVSALVYALSKFSFAPLVDLFLKNSQVARALLWIANIFSPLLPEVMEKINNVI